MFSVYTDEQQKVTLERFFLKSVKTEKPQIEARVEEQKPPVSRQGTFINNFICVEPEHRPY